MRDFSFVAMKCPYEGSVKVVSNISEHASPLYCQGHAEDWIRQFPNSILIRKSIFAKATGFFRG